MGNKALTPMMYNIAVDPEQTFTYLDKEWSTTFVMTVVGGEADGQIVCCGPGEMSTVMLGMMRLAAYAHAGLRNDAEKLHSVLIGEDTHNLEGI